MVGVTGFEPATLCSQSRCATKLRYTPKDSCPMHHHTGADATCRARGRLALGSSVSPLGVRGCSSMVEPLPSKQITRVRFPSSAPKGRHSGYKGFRHGQELSRVAFSLFCGGFGVLKPDAWCRGGASDGGRSEPRRGDSGARSVRRGRKHQKMWPCVKRLSSASKSTASCSHRSTRKRQGPKERPETEFEKPGHVGFGPNVC